MNPAQAAAELRKLVSSNYFKRGLGKDQQRAVRLGLWALDMITAAQARLPEPEMPSA